MKRFRAHYGAAPLHLLAIILSFVIVAAAIINWFHARTHTGNIILWYLGCFVVVEFVLIPLAWALDHTAYGRGLRRNGRPPCAGWVYVRVPAMLSGLMLIVFLPLIVRPDDSTFRAYTGMAPSVYLVRWLLASAAMFAASGLLYALRRARIRSRPAHHQPKQQDPDPRPACVADDAPSHKRRPPATPDV
jgi:hypothetical protein